MNLINQIKQWENDKNISELVNILKETNPFHKTAKEILVRIGDSAVDELVKKIETNLKQQLEHSRLYSCSDFGEYIPRKCDLHIIADILGDIGNPKAINPLIRLIYLNLHYEVRVSTGMALQKLGAAKMDNRKCILIIYKPKSKVLYEFSHRQLNMKGKVLYEFMCPNCHCKNEKDLVENYVDNVLGKDSNLTMADGFSFNCEMGKLRCPEGFDWVEGYGIEYEELSTEKKWWQFWK